MTWRWFLLALTVSSLLLWLMLGCAASEGDIEMSGSDGDGDGDGDSDSDSDVDIIYPEHIVPLLNLDDVMTGPISPPPEEFDVELTSGDDDDWDAGVLEDGLDEEGE